MVQPTAAGIAYLACRLMTTVRVTWRVDLDGSRAVTLNVLSDTADTLIGTDVKTGTKHIIDKRATESIVPARKTKQPAQLSF